MRNLFEIDTKDYDRNGTVFERPSVRGIMIRTGRVAMIHSLKYDYYKFPGGGIEEGEDNVSALIREVREETGLIVIPETIKEYGRVYVIQKGIQEDVFIQDNYYYLCDAEEEIRPQDLDEYEEEERFTLEFIEPQRAIWVNRENTLDEVDQIMLKREERVLEILLQEGYL